MNPIEKEFLKKLDKKYTKNPTNTVVRHALSTNDISALALNKDNIKDMDFNFSIDIKTMSATNQKASGRCWIFAATNFLREDIAKRCKISKFELSQSYVAFYDKLEKLNLTLEILIELLDKDYDDRTLQFILQQGIGDGGQWDMFVNVVKKYGICPKNAYVETATSSGTRILNQLLNTELRHFASEAREVNKKGGLEAVKELKEDYLSRFYIALVNCYGVPPAKFDFEYVDKEDKYHLKKGFTPMSFFKEYVGDSIDEYVSVIDAPTKDKPLMKSYTVKYLGNVVDGKPVKHLNVGIERLKELVIAQLKDKQIVWFGSDVSFYRDTANAKWDDEALDFKSLLNLDFKFDKGDAIDFRGSQMNHAMCITGVNLKNDVPTKWKIENSWGEQGPNGGYYIMSASWFDRYTYQAVVNKKYLTKEELDAYNAEPIELKPWDPMGSLAD